VLKAVLERKGMQSNTALNTVGKHIFWLQYWGQFHVALEYVKSENNKADKFTRKSPGLEASISQVAFQVIREKWGPFEYQWDIMAFSAIVKRDPQGNELHFFSRCFDPLSKRSKCFRSRLHQLTRDFLLSVCSNDL